MSQHDYAIANGGGAAVRADINLALAAILSQNSGATAPTTTKPFMFWYDSANSVLKMRNPANDGWLVITDTGGAILAPIIDGAVTTAKIADANITAQKLSGAQSGSAPIYGARAWVNFNGTGTVAIRASGNVSSITDNGTGDYTVNFATAMPDVNYSVTGNAMRNQAAGNNLTAMSIYPSITYSDAFAAGSFRTRTQDYAGGAQDPLAVTVAIFR